MDVCNADWVLAMQTGFHRAKTSWYKISACQGCWKLHLCLTMPVSLVRALGEHINVPDRWVAQGLWGEEHSSGDGTGLQRKSSSWQCPGVLLCAGVCTAQPTEPCGISPSCSEASTSLCWLEWPLCTQKCLQPGRAPAPGFPNAAHEGHKAQGAGLCFLFSFCWRSLGAGGGVTLAALRGVTGSAHCRLQPCHRH